MVAAADVVWVTKNKSIGAVPDESRYVDRSMGNCADVHWRSPPAYQRASRPVPASLAVSVLARLAALASP